LKGLEKQGVRYRAFNTGPSSESSHSFFQQQINARSTHRALQ
jgi:hypothetical protein